MCRAGPRSCFSSNSTTCSDRAGAPCFPPARELAGGAGDRGQYRPAPSFAFSPAPARRAGLQPVFRSLSSVGVPVQRAGLQPGTVSERLGSASPSSFRTQTPRCASGSAGRPSFSFSLWFSRSKCRLDEPAYNGASVGKDLKKLPRGVTRGSRRQRNCRSDIRSQTRASGATRWALEPCSVRLPGSSRSRSTSSRHRSAPS